MTITELLVVMRSSYIQQLSAATHDHEYHIEAALRLADGRIAYDGKLNIPCRYDLIRKDTGEVHPVDAAYQIDLAPLQLILNSKLLDISTFSWDWLALNIFGITEDDVTQLMRDWYMRWFDEDDLNSPNVEGLYGVVHFMSDPEPINGGVRFHIDLGSVQASAVAELVEALLNQGTSALAMGTE